MDLIGIYARQSVDKKDSISIESQIDFCKKEITKEEFKVYIDKGFSGKNTERPNFQAMITDIKNGLLKRVIVYKLDRISRNLLDFAKIIDVFKKYNVDFTSCSEKFDTNTPIGNAMLSIIMVFAQLERETIQKRIKDNYYARGAKGFSLGGRIPYGFTKDQIKVDGKKTYVYKENPEQILYLEKMFNLYANTDMSLGKISDYLNNNKIPAPQGGLWDSCKISRILRNPAYVAADADIYTYYKNKGCIISNEITDFVGVNGCYLYGKREANERKYTNVENHVLSLALHQGIVDSNIFLLCQYKLDSNKQIKNSGKGKYSWLSGIVKCGYCGYAVSVVTGRGDLKYFNCRGKTNYKICQGHSKPLYVTEIEDIIKKEIITMGEKFKNTELKTYKNDDNTINKLKIQILEIDKQIENLINQMAESNDIVIKYINQKMTSLDKAKNELNEEIKKISINNSKNISTDKIVDNVNNWDNLSLEEKKNVCNFFIDKIYLKDDEIDIKRRI